METLCQVPPAKFFLNHDFRRIFLNNCFIFFKVYFKLDDKEIIFSNFDSEMVPYPMIFFYLMTF